MTSKTATEKTNTTQDTGPGKAVEPYWQELLGGASEAVKRSLASSPAPFTGSLFAAVDPSQTRALEMMESTAPALAQGASDVRGFADRIARGEFLDVANNPYFKSAADAVSSNVTRALNKDWLKAATDQARAQGAYGGVGTDISNERLISRAAEEVAKGTAGLATNYYNTGAGMTGYIPTLYNQANTMLTMPAEQIGMAGTQRREFEKERIKSELDKYMMGTGDAAQQLAPYAAWANILNAPGYRSTTGTSLKETTTPPPDLATMILQGVTGAGGLMMGYGTALPGMKTAWGNIFGPKTA